MTPICTHFVTVTRVGHVPRGVCVVGPSSVCLDPPLELEKDSVPCRGQNIGDMAAPLQSFVHILGGVTYNAGHGGVQRAQN